MTYVPFTYNNVHQQLANFEAIDYFYAKEILSALRTEAELSEQQQQIVFHLLLALSTSVREGHTWVSIAEISGCLWGTAVDEQGINTHQGFLFPTFSELQELLYGLNISCECAQPIVFHNDSLYMRRYFQFENELAQGIKKRLETIDNSTTSDITQIVSQLFPSEPQTTTNTEIDWQKLAVANAINKNFTVIAGGPGTGKTYTVTKLLAALLMLDTKTNHLQSNKKLDIALVAPTGKAAQRLSESITNAITGFKGLINEEILSKIPTQAKTIHRLLGVIPNNPNFRHNQNNLLTCDVILIDEVSMVDLPMMTRIFRALKSDSKVILLGDADQLPSVAVGSVLADIAPRPHRGYSKENTEYLHNICQVDPVTLNSTFDASSKDKGGYADYLSFLLKSRRFDGEGEIGQLASNVIQGNSAQSWQLLESSSESEHLQNNNQLRLTDHNIQGWLLPLIKSYYQNIMQCKDIICAFEILSKFRVLCVTRQGEFGVDAINLWVKEQLLPRYQLSEDTYHGMPIMISENDYRLGLYNGDIGILWRSAEGNLLAYFESSEEGRPFKTFIPSRLPKYDAVYAMTIHKTQGSEFEHVAIILPKKAEHQLLSRELIYTGITRAKKQLTIASNKQTWLNTVNTGIKRYSGLRL